MNNDTRTREERIAERINPESASLITTGSNGALAFNDASQLMEFAKMMAVAQVAVPKHLRESPGACLAVAIQASEWQMSPFAVANKSYSVNDRLAYEAQLINAVILRRAPIKGRFKIEYSGDGQKRRCKVSVVLAEDDSTVEYESPEIGSITVKNSPQWKSDPDQQLFYYSSRAMCRRHFPDVLLGVYTQDELQDLPTEREVRPVVSAAESPLFKAPSKAAPTLVLESSAPTPRETFLAKVQALGVPWEKVGEVLFQNGVLNDPRATASDCEDGEIEFALASWDKLSQIVKGGSSK